MIALILGIYAQTLHFQSQKSLPTWSDSYLEDPIPVYLQEEDVLVLLDEVVVHANDDGSVRVIHRSLRKVQSELGVERASVFSCFNQLGGTKVERLDGWHRFANGNLEVLGSGQIVTVGAPSSNAVHDGQVTIGYFRKVARGSVIAFESEEIVDLFLGPILPFPILADMPTVHKLFRVEQAELIQLQPLNLEAWGLIAQPLNDGLEFKLLPADRQRDWAPQSRGYWPVVFARMKHARTDSYRNWNELAHWYNGVFTKAALPNQKERLKPLTKLGLFNQTAQSIKSKLAYRQVYLSPHRGWIPDAGEEVFKRSFGDCKDMVSCSAYLLAEQNVSAYPTLANVYDGFDFKAQDPANPWFNHVIVAIPLQATLGLASEVVAREKRFLLYDPTAQHTPAGTLPRAFLGRHVLICTADGGYWISVPESALEPARTDFSLNGDLDEANGFRGEFVILEKGNAIGVRQTLSSSTKMNRENWIRKAFQIPVDAKVELLDFQSDELGGVSLRLHVTWPQFLKTGPLGSRLPPAIVPPALSYYGQNESRRQAPLALPSWPLQSWTITLKCERPLQPLQAEFDWSNEHHRIHWQVNTDSQLLIRFETQGNSEVFTGKRVTLGLSQLAELQLNYERFALFTPLFSL